MGIWGFEDPWGKVKPHADSLTSSVRRSFWGMGTRSRLSEPLGKDAEAEGL